MKQVIHGLHLKILAILESAKSRWNSNSSNLCTEITLNTSNDEIAVCNLGSINLVNHLDGRDLDRKKYQNY